MTSLFFAIQPLAEPTMGPTLADPFLSKAIDTFERGQTTTALIMVVVGLLIGALGFIMKVMYDRQKDLEGKIDGLEIVIRHNADEASEARDKAAAGLLEFAKESVAANTRGTAAIVQVERTVDRLVEEMRRWRAHGGTGTGGQ